MKEMISSIEYSKDRRFENFERKMAHQKVAVLFDIHTKPYAQNLMSDLERNGTATCKIFYDDEDLLPKEEECAYALEKANGCAYVLAVGSGTLNDMAKSTATKLGVPSGVLATAASMDGYLSKGAALMRGGFKVTDSVNPPQDVLIDLDIIRRAPREMTAAGFGDIIGKYTCLTDWKLSHILKGEPIHRKAYDTMLQARNDCMDVYDGLVRGEAGATDELMKALLTAGEAMAMCGNSRPASGSEHHMSHYLEMDFARRGERIPMHGFKVGIGTLVSVEIYRYIRNHKIDLPHKDEIDALVDDLPEIEWIKAKLEGIGCPTRFSQIGVRRETMEEMLDKAYTVRDRFTVLTLSHDLGLMDQMKGELIDHYW